MGKTLNDKISQLVASKLKVQQLTAALKKARPKKRKKVKANFNEEFIRLKRIRKVKERIKQP